MGTKDKFLLGCIFWGGLGIVSLSIGLYIIIAGTGPRGQNLLLNEYNNPFIKYALGYLFVGFSIPGLAFPFLAYKGILTIDYSNSTIYQKAKNNFVLCSLMIPTVLILIVIFYAKGIKTGLNYSAAIICFIAYLAVYIYATYSLLKNRKPKNS